MSWYIDTVWEESHKGLYEDLKEDYNRQLSILSEAYDIIDQRISIKKIIANNDATIVFWADGTKTVVKKMKGDNDDIYSAVAQALAKKLYGSTTHFHKIVDETLIDKKPTIKAKEQYPNLILLYQRFDSPDRTVKFIPDHYIRVNGEIVVKVDSIYEDCWARISDLNDYTDRNYSGWIDMKDSSIPIKHVKPANSYSPDGYLILGYGLE